MLQRNLLYTGVTRGKRLVVLVGQKKAVAIAVRNASGRRRWSKLSEWLASKNIDAKKDNYDCTLRLYEARRGVIVTIFLAMGSSDPRFIAAAILMPTTSLAARSGS